jgi:hypothetical protein
MTSQAKERTDDQFVKAGKAYVKISGASRASSHAPDYADVNPLAKALSAANRSISSGAPTGPSGLGHTARQYGKRRDAALSDQ